MPVVPPIKSSLFTQNNENGNQHSFSRELCTVSTQTLADLTGFHCSDSFVCYFSSHKACSHKASHFLATLTNEVGIAGVNGRNVFFNSVLFFFFKTNRKKEKILSSHKLLFESIRFYQNRDHKDPKLILQIFQN